MIFSTIKKILVLIIVAFISVLITLWVTQTNDSVNLQQAEALIEKTTQNSVTINDHFDAYANLEGFVIEGKDPKSPIGIVYTDKAGRYLISGQIFSEDGTDIVKSDYLQHVQPQSAIDAWNSIQKTTWIQQGDVKSPHKLYVIADPNCRFCHQLYDDLQTEINNGNVAVRWVLIGFLKPSSKGRALAILAADDPLKAMSINEKGFNDANEEGGIPPLAEASPSAQQALDNNMNFMIANRLTATPIILYKAQNGVVNELSGLPVDNKLDTLINSASNHW